MDINKFIEGLDKERLEAGMQNIKKMMGTKEGQELLQKLQKIDKSNLVQKLNNAGPDVPDGNAIDRLTGDPNLVGKLNDFLDGNK